MVVDVEHPTRGTFTMPGCPIQLSASPVEVEPSPLLGQPNAQIFRKLLGLQAEDLANLQQEGIV